MRLFDDPETGLIYCDDNLERLCEMKPESVDLIYLDPPFFSNRKYEVIWGDEAEVRSFEDRWKGGIQNYIDWMKPRVAEMHRVLKPNGSFYLHCDPAASHYLKILLDEIFGQSRFLNEITWKRTTAHNDPKRYGRIQDRIFFYSKTSEKTFNSLPGSYSDEQMRRYKYRDERGPFRAENLTAPHHSSTRTIEWRGTNPGANRQWRFALEELERLYEEGYILLRRDGCPRKDGYKVYLEEAGGPALQDIWTDIGIGPTSSERLGYPTQKPLALLERIVGVSSNPGDVVLDPFCGCGTTIAAAQQMRRRWIGIDISLTAAEIMKARVEKLGAEGVRIKGDPRSEADLARLKPFEFQNWVIRKIYGSHSPRLTGDMGIDGFSYFERLPIQIKRSRRVGRPVVDSFETAVERGGAKKGYIVAFSFTRGAYEEVARAKNAKKLEIELIEAEDIRTGVSTLVPPRAGRKVLKLEGPPKEARPSAQRLVESDKEAGEVA